MQTDIDQIRELIARDKIDKALELLRTLTESKPDLDNQASKLAIELKDVRRKEIVGTMSYDKVMESRTEISNSVLGILNQLKNYVPVKDTAAKKVFISYNHNDSIVAHQLKEKLTLQNINVIIDTEKMLAGQDIKNFIETSVRETETTISIISRKSLLSSWVAAETINTFYHEKFLKEKKFIACYIENDFLKRGFTDEAWAIIDKELDEILAAKEKRIKQRRNTRDLDNEFTRFSELKNSMDEIIRRLKESLCIDISGDQLDKNLAKIIEAIKA